MLTGVYEVNAVLVENKKLKEDQNVLVTSFNQRVKELEETNVKMQKDREEKSKVIIVIQQSKCTETLDKAQSTCIDATVSS